jgi:hypothetical protein
MLRHLGAQRDDVAAFVLPHLPETHWTIWGGEAASIGFATNPLLEPAMMRELLKAAVAPCLRIHAASSQPDPHTRPGGVNGKNLSES